MNPKKQKEKDRRRARKLAEQAWEAVDQGNLDLAEKIIRRAVAAQEDNPVLWNDQGVLLSLRDKQGEAEKSFRAALSLTPSFAEAYTHLAAMRFREGYADAAIALQSLAVKYAPGNADYAERLQAYQASIGDPALKPEGAGTTPPRTVEPASDESGCDWNDRLNVLDWHLMSSQLTRDGYAIISRLIDPETCELLRGMFDDDCRFAKTVVMDQPDFGKGVYRYFASPIPGSVDRLRRAVYPHVALIANRWRELLEEPDRFPAEWEAFRETCHRVGQTKPTPILLKYGAGGFNALHRDLRGDLFFPIQMAVLLSARVDSSHEQTDGFQGGQFLFCDVPEGRKSRHREIEFDQGDAILFCTRDRLVRVGGAYGFQPVKHGVAPITAGTRFVLGVPFHEYR